MTKDEFQNASHDFMTSDEQEARAKAAEYNARGVDGDTIVAAKFGDMWCVMLSKAYAFTRELGIE